MSPFAGTASSKRSNSGTKSDVLATSGCRDPINPPRGTAIHGKHIDRAVTATYVDPIALGVEKQVVHAAAGGHCPGKSSIAQRDDSELRRPPKRHKKMLTGFVEHHREVRAPAFRGPRCNFLT